MAGKFFVISWHEIQIFSLIVLRAIWRVAKLMKYYLKIKDILFSFFVTFDRCVKTIDTATCETDWKN
jgi:hypothetical protein